jgi:hypothetical protein
MHYKSFGTSIVLSLIKALPNIIRTSVIMHGDAVCDGQKRDELLRGFGLPTPSLSSNHKAEVGAVINLDLSIIYNKLNIKGDSTKLHDAILPFQINDFSSWVSAMIGT